MFQELESKVRNTDYERLAIAARMRSNQPRKTRIVLVASSRPSFVETDRQILSADFEVRSITWRGKRSIPRLAFAIVRSDLAFSWFALDHAYAACRLARAFRKKSLVVVGGIDAAKRADLEYGVHLNPTMGARSVYTIAHTDRVLVVDDSLREEIAKNTGIQRADILTIPTGYDVDRFRPDGGPKTNVLTVGIVNDANLRRKGLWTFLQTARLLPDIPFVLVGVRENQATRRLRAASPPNLRLEAEITADALLEEYRRARVYVQLSLYEGLPNALAEAMSCGCLPVGTRVAGIPTLIGDSGFFVRPEDPEGTAETIGRSYATADGARARDRIVKEFALDRRRKALSAVIESLVRGEGK